MVEGPGTCGEASNQRSRSPAQEIRGVLQSRKRVQLVIRKNETELQKYFARGMVRRMMSCEDRFCIKLAEAVLDNNLRGFCCQSLPPKLAEQMKSDFVDPVFYF